MQSKFFLQKMVLPTAAFGAQRDMYVRSKEDCVQFDNKHFCLKLAVGERASFDTFFNSLTIQAWRQNTIVNDLSLQLKGAGLLRLRLGVISSQGLVNWIEDCEVQLTPEKYSEVKIEAWRELFEGILYYELEALEVTQLCEAIFSTTTQPLADCRLGIVVTHFNRKDFLLPAIQRVKKELLDDADYKGKIELIVVDNSQNIAADESVGATVIPNANLGGSGGFARGLYFLEKRAEFTHCLFMDDDASCEIESLRRAYAFLALAKPSVKVAVAGSMLLEQEPNRLYEKGAIFDGRCEQLCSGLDMRNVKDLIEAETQGRQPNYGAWWFFAFRLGDIKEYPFPFFIRGDDIRFSIANGLHVVTMNGIATWGENFLIKDSPLTVYFDARSQLLLSMNLMGKNRFQLAFSFLKTLQVKVLSYKYASAETLIMAMDEFINNPNMFNLDNDLSKIRQKVMAFDGECMVSMDLSIAEDVVEVGGEPGWRKFLRVITINGMLLPPMFVSKDMLVCSKSKKVNFSEIFGYRRICYYHQEQARGYISELDWWRFVRLNFRALAKLACLIVSYDDIKKHYEIEVPRLTGKVFWRDVFTYVL